MVISSASHSHGPTVLAVRYSATQEAHMLVETGRGNILPHRFVAPRAAVSV